MVAKEFIIIAGMGISVILACTVSGWFIFGMIALVFAYRILTR